jgi:hypothetical protein
VTTIRARLSLIVASAALVAVGITALAPAANAAVPACGNSSLAVSHTAPQGAAGHGMFFLLFRNTSLTPCILSGYPGLDARDSVGHIIAHAQRTLSGAAGGAHVVSPVTVAPGNYASAGVEWLNFNPTTGGNCRFSASILTTPPNTTHSVAFAVSVSLCQLQVHPVVAGTTGQQATGTPPICNNGSLGVYHSTPQGATGHASFVLWFKNVTLTPCRIYGYPGLDARDAAGHTLAHAARTQLGFAGGAHVVAVVTIAPGNFASAVVEWMNFNPVNGGNCVFSKSVATTPANTTHTVVFPVSVSLCSLQVHPTVAGTTGDN